MLRSVPRRLPRLSLELRASAMENKTTDIDPSEDVVQWLKEVGQRKWPGRQPSSAECNAPPPTESPSEHAPIVRRTLLLLLLLVLSLHYVYAYTTLEILSLPSLLVFAFTG